MYLTTSDASVVAAAVKREEFVRDAKARRFARLVSDKSGRRLRTGRQ